MLAIAERSPQDVLDDKALDELLKLLPYGHDEQELFRIIEGTTISRFLAKLFVSGIGGEFFFSNGEKRIIRSRGWV